MDLTQLALVAFLVEALLQTVKPIYDREKGWNKNILFALVVGIAICTLTGTDLFTRVGLTISVPYVGSVLTGVLASRGSNFLHDIFKFVQNQAIGTDPEQSGVG